MSTATNIIEELQQLLTEREVSIGLVTLSKVNTLWTGSRSLTDNRNSNTVPWKSGNVKQAIQWLEQYGKDTVVMEYQVVDGAHSPRTGKKISIEAQQKPYDRRIKKIADGAGYSMGKRRMRIEQGHDFPNHFQIISKSF